jgi:hypothetical protein
MFTRGLILLILQVCLVDRDKCRISDSIINAEPKSRRMLAYGPVCGIEESARLGVACCDRINGFQFALFCESQIQNVVRRER